MARRTLIGTLLGSISLVAFCAPALAAGSIETITVTAEKRTEEVKNVPMGITVLGEQQLSKNSDTSFADYINRVPGMNYTASDPGHTVLILRGINAGGTGATIGTYIDETPYGSTSALANGTNSTPNIDTFDIARIEVLRGPQGTLYGSSTLGGLLKFVPNAPSTDGFDDKFEVGGTDVNHGGSGYSVKGMVNFGLSDTTALRVSGYRQETGGFIDDPGRGLTDINGVQTTGGRASFLFAPSEDLSFRLNVLLQDMKIGNDSVEDVTIVGGRIVPLFGDYQQMRVDSSPTAVGTRVYNLTGDWNFGGADLTSATSYGTFNSRQVTDATGVYTVDLSAFLRLKKFTQEVRLASPVDGRSFDWLLGGYYTNETGALHQVLPTFGTLDLDSRYTEIAAFANGTYHFSDRFDIALGGRYSHNSQVADEFGLATGGGASKDDVFTWSAASRFHLDEDTVLYARIAKGYRPGGPNVLPPSPPPIPPTVPFFFKSDSLINYEVGVKGDLFDGKVSYDADVFLIDWSDIQILEVVAGYGVNGNGGGARSEGFEWNIGYNPVDQLALGFGGAYTDAYLTTDVPLFNAFAGDPLPWAPLWTTAISAEYTFNPIGSVTPVVGGAFRYVGERYTGFDPTGQLKVPGYTTVDLHTGVDWEDWSLMLYAKNVGDSKSYTDFTSTGTSAASGGAAIAGVTQPREIGIKLTGKI